MSDEAKTQWKLYEPSHSGEFATVENTKSDELRKDKEEVQDEEMKNIYKEEDAGFYEQVAEVQKLQEEWEQQQELEKMKQKRITKGRRRTTKKK